MRAALDIARACALLALLAHCVTATMYVPSRPRVLWLAVLPSPEGGLSDCRYTCRTFGMEIVYT